MDWRTVDMSHIVDLHVHSAPDLIARSGDDLNLAREANEARVRGMVLKPHFMLTAPRAYLCEKVLAGPTRLFGAIALNPPVGGLNPVAVETALKFGARVV